MKSNIALAASATSALLTVLPFSATPVNAQAVATTIATPTTTTTSLTNYDLANYGLTLDQFNSIRRSESPIDFGGLPSSGDTDQLWLDAAEFEYEVATSHPPTHAKSMSGYHPYLICSTSPNLSGQERADAVTSIFQTTPNISSSDYYTGGNLFHNDDTMSCGVLRTYNDTISKVYNFHHATASSSLEHVYVNPLHASMKMVENTVEVMQSWFNEEEDAGDVVSINDGDSGNIDDNMIQVKVLGLHMVLCPGVQNFDGNDENVTTDDEGIANDIKNFVTGNGGGTVQDVSFYHHRVSGMDGNAVHTERMDQWSAAITAVTNWTKTTENENENENESGVSTYTNPCLDQIIHENMLFTVDKRILEVNAKLSFKEGNELGQSLGFTEEDMETCIWYMTYALAVNPMVCSLEPRTGVRTLCKDGTSDLDNCTGDDDNGDGGDNGGGDSSSSSRIGAGSWRNNASWMSATLLLVVLGIASV